jgi:ribosomal protein S18 acetylase RimI-like enzyme
MSTTFTLRAARMTDAQAVTDLFNEHSSSLYGVAEVTAEEIRQFWEAPDIDPEQDAVLAEAGDGSLLAYGDIGDWGGEAIWLDVRGFDPEAQRAIIARLEVLAEAKRPGAQLMGFVTENDTVVRRLYEECGYRIARHSFRMEADLAELPPEPPLPAGVAIRTVHDGEEERVYEVHQETFEDVWMHTRDPYEEWVHWFLKDPSFDPSLWFIAEAGDDVAGIAICRPQESRPGVGWVRVLGVRRPFRRRGVGEALLRRAFAEFARRGFERVGLGVDAASPTGAVALYERAGMRVAVTNLQYERVQR